MKTLLFTIVSVLVISVGTSAWAATCQQKAEALDDNTGKTNTSACMAALQLGYYDSKKCKNTSEADIKAICCTVVRNKTGC